MPFILLCVDLGLAHGMETAQMWRSHCIALHGYRRYIAWLLGMTVLLAMSAPFDLLAFHPLGLAPGKGLPLPNALLGTPRLLSDAARRGSISFP